MGLHPAERVVLPAAASVINAHGYSDGLESTAQHTHTRSQTQIYKGKRVMD